MGKKLILKSGKETQKWFKPFPKPQWMRGQLLLLAILNGTIVVLTKIFINLSMFWTLPFFIIGQMVISILLFLKIYRKYDISILGNLFDGISMIIVIFGSYFLLGENLNIYNIIGVLFIIIGVFLL
jgi:multidrug transporter EmrE-like cation transporter